MTAADFTDSQHAEQRLRDAANRLQRMAKDVAKAKQVREFASDRRKNLLARYQAPLLATTSYAASEPIARANEAYQAEFEDLAAQFADAEHVLAEWAATNATLEAARSILSLNKTLIQNMQE